VSYELFIAKKIFMGKEAKQKISGSIVRLATGGIALSLMIMIIAVGIVVGFKKEVRNKLIGFGSDVQVSASFSNQTYETVPIQFDTLLINKLKQQPSVLHVQPFATLPGIMKVGDDFHGMVFKGVDAQYDWSFFQKNLKEGEICPISDSSGNQTLISKKIADLLHLKVGDKFHTYFVINGKVRVRPLSVSGIYSTGFSDYDNLFVVGDIRHIRKLNQWEDDQCSGIEIDIHDFNQLEEAKKEIYSVVGNRFDNKGNYYMMKDITEINPQIFGWLDLLDTNVVIIFILMIAVAGFTMISGLLILILDRTNMIGVLKAMGANNASIQKLFLYIALFIVGKGMLIGNFLAFTFCFLQKKFGIIQLDPEVYYVESVPVELSWLNILWVNVGVFLLSTIILRLSTFIITKISPIRSIRFE
jgi:lipoprotein-releasing system permease protein